jgi:hypothetical protein
MVKLLLVLVMSGAALAESLAPAPPPLLIDSGPAPAAAPLDASN